MSEQEAKARPDGRPRLVKLVRDDVAKFLGDDNTVTYLPIDDREVHAEALRAKLVEEAVEYALRPSLGELADVLETIRALVVVDLEFHPDPEMALEFVMDEADGKRAERGGFIDGVGMFVQTKAGPRHEGEHHR